MNDQGCTEARVNKIRAGDTPVALVHRPGLTILHFIPHAATPQQLEYLRSQSGALVPWEVSSYDIVNNFDGLVIYSGAEDEAWAYTQVFRSGMIELVTTDTVCVDEATQTRTVWVHTLAKRIVNKSHDILHALRRGEVDPPYSIHLTLSGVQGASFTSDDAKAISRLEHSSIPVRRDVLQFLNASVTANDVTRDHVVTALRPTLDQLFQTAGYSQHPAI